MADPQTPAAAAPAAPAAPPIKKREYRFKFVTDTRFSIDNLLVQGTLEATVQFNDKLSASYKTMSIDGAQSTEKVIDPRDQSKTMKFGMNELTIMQVYQTLVAINGKAIPPAMGALVPGETNPRMQIIRGLPTIFFDQIVEGLNEFDGHCKELIADGAIRNF
jgi:hypothetical protein